MTRYRTIVADPPWPYPDDRRGWGVGVGVGSWHADAVCKGLPSKRDPLVEVVVVPRGPERVADHERTQETR